MSPANDTGASSKYAVWLAHHVRRVSSCLESPHGFVVYVTCRQLLTFSQERVATSAFEIVTRLNKEHFNAIVRHGAFADLTVCITDFCKVSKYQKISLLAIAMLRGVIPVMLECPECAWAGPAASPTTPTPMDDNMIKYWYPVLFGF